MNHSEDRLSQAFRDLAAEAPQRAPAALGVRLQDSFRKHHIRRRRVRLFTGVSVLAACVVLAFVFVSLRHRSISHRTTIDGTMSARDTSHQDNQAAENDDARSGVSLPSHPTNVTPNIRKKYANAAPSRKQASSGNIAKGFTPLPSYDPSYPATGYQIVRVGLQDTALSQLGLPVHESSSGKQVVADLLLDRDGMPIAVRFPNAQKLK